MKELLNSILPFIIWGFHLDKHIFILISENFTHFIRKDIMPMFRGVVESRWAPRSSKSVAGRNASRGGFDFHSLPPFIS